MAQYLSDHFDCPISDITAVFSSESIAKDIFERLFIHKFEIRVK